MQSDLRSEITAFVGRIHKQSLFKGTRSNENISKSGLLPFVIERGEIYFLFMIPESRDNMPKSAGPALAQIAKGTRMAFENGEWRDCKESDFLDDNVQLENLEVNALREAIEETGLKLSNISALFPGKAYPFTSASTGAQKSVYICAAQLKNRDDFNAPDSSASATKNLIWLTAEEFMQTGREDHKPIVRDIHETLLQQLNSRSSYERQ